MNIQESKILNSILYFADKSDTKTITRLKLMKLLWLSDRLHLNKYGRLILNDRYKALPNGPVASKALAMSKHNIDAVYRVSGRDITAIAKPDLDYFSKSDLEVMDYIWNKFNQDSPWFLRELSHQFPEWKRFEKELSDKNSPNAYDMVIQDFFLSADVEKFTDILDDETIALSKEQFNIHSSIQSALKN